MRGLDVAIFYDLANQAFKFPASLIRGFYFDADGYICFNIDKPYVDVTGMDNAFHSQLHFHKKDVPWSIDLSGMATFCLVEELSSNKVFIKFRISQAKCFYMHKARPSICAYVKQRIGYFIKRFYQDIPNYTEIALE